MKRIIRLTEEDLHRIIKESVNNFIKESDYMDDGDLEKQYDKHANSLFAYGWNGNHGVCFPSRSRPWGTWGKKDENDTSWCYFDAARDGSKALMKYRSNLDAKYPLDLADKRKYLDGWNYEKKTYDTPMSSFKNRLNKQWKDTQDIEKYSKMADSRPLHRKGSLNRAFDESFQRKYNLGLTEAKSPKINKNVLNEGY